VQTTAYRIAQEALTNVVRHSAASHATVTVEHDAGDLVLTVADDGAGIPATASERGGLRGMRERAALAGGALSVDSGTRGTRGTAVVARLPWRGAA
jgi:signal transduction histidine kinase